jgi:hypothetical protein
VDQCEAREQIKEKSENIMDEWKATSGAFKKGKKL